MGCGGCVRVEPLWLPLLMGGRWTWPARCTLMREIWNQWRFHTSRQTRCWLYILHRRRQTESRSWCWYSAQNNAPWLFKKKDSYWSVEHHRLIVSPNFITGFKIRYQEKWPSSSLRRWQDDTQKKVLLSPASHSYSLSPLTVKEAFTYLMLLRSKSFCMINVQMCRCFFEWFIRLLPFSPEGRSGETCQNSVMAKENTNMTALLASNLR